MTEKLKISSTINLFKSCCLLLVFQSARKIRRGSIFKALLCLETWILPSSSKSPSQMIFLLYTGTSTLIIYICSWQWQPCIAGCRLFRTLLWAKLVDFVQFFCKIHFFILGTAAKFGVFGRVLPPPPSPPKKLVLVDALDLSL